MNARRVIVIQQGARRNYIYARQLEAAGLLNYLGCDAAWPEQRPGWIPRLARWLSPRIAGSLRRRMVPGIAPERVCGSLWPNVAAFSKHVLPEERAFDFIDETLGLRLRLRGLNGANVVLNYFGNGGSFLSYAKRCGARVVTDFISSPKAREIERRECAAWPGWDDEETSQESVDAYRRRFIWLLGLSDIYLCPSEAVADDLAELPGFDATRVRIVPYGTSGVLMNDPQPEPGRVLFAGSSPVRKGLPYLAQAASILKAEHPEVRIIVAGDVSPSVRRRRETQDLEFLGHLDRGAMASEFARADIFCLPSLSEGSATAIFEALAHGLPVVTTRATGSVVRDHVEGLIVPARDGSAIASAIGAIVGDRRQRMSMSAAATAASARYDEICCGEEFIRVIRECANLAPHSLGNGSRQWT